MKKYKIKSEAVPFILEKHATKNYPLETWEGLGISLNALDEVKPPFISYGKEKGRYSDLCGWSKDDGSKFEFTINFPSAKMQEYENMKKESEMRKLMDAIQSLVDRFYSDFNFEE